MKLNKQLLGAAALMVAGFTTGHAQLIISEVHPTGSSSSTYGKDWFELKNPGASTLNLTDWKMDDNSGLFTSAVALRGVVSLAPGQVAVFMESDATGSSDVANGALFTSAWFGSSVPVDFILGFYGGTQVSLSSGGDAVNIYDSVGTVMAGVSFLGATTGVTFDNAAGLSDTISQLSVAGVNGAFNSFAGGEIGSPGVAVVPEPTGLSLGALGLVALMFRKQPAKN